MWGGAVGREFLCYFARGGKWGSEVRGCGKQEVKISAGGKCGANVHLPGEYSLLRCLKFVLGFIPVLP